MRILLSIKPEFAYKIFSGEKKYEYRRTIFKNRNVRNIIVYVSSPVSKVIGEFEIECILSDLPEKIWNKTHKESGITKPFFDRYTEKKKKIYAIKIGKTRKYKNDLFLEKDFNLNFAPQSFVYL
jgi:predicted transcriptional regulator